MAALALPLIGGQLAGMLQSTLTVLVAGRLGAGVLGPIAVGEGVWSLAFLAAVGFSNALPAVVSQLDGARRRHEAGAAFGNALVIAAVLGLLLSAALFVGGPGVIAALGLDPALRGATIAFLRAVAPAAPAVTLYFACRGLSDGLGRTRPGMVSSVAALLLLPAFLWLLLWRTHSAAGAGSAGAAVFWLQLGCFAGWLRWSGRYRGLGPLAPSWSGIAALLRLGLPMTAGVLLEGSLFSAVGLLMGRLGAVPAAAHAVALNAAALSFMVPLGLATAITVRVGRAAGRGDRAGARRAGLTGMAMAIGFEALTGVLLLTFPHRVAGLFTGDTAVVAAAVPLLLLAGVFQFADGLQVTAAGALRGLRDVTVPVAITAASYWGVGLPTALLLGFGLGWQAPGLWAGLAAGLSTAAVLLSWRFVAVVGRRVPDAR